MSTVAIMQPTYMPWIGYFSMIDKVDKFVFLDDVQLVKRSWQVRNKIKQNDNEVMLTIPIIKDKTRKNMLINNTRYNNMEGWKYKHLKSIKYSYSKAKYFNEVYPFLEELYKLDFKSIGDFTSKLIIDICNKIGIETVLIFSSDLIKPKVTKDKLLSTICQKLGAKRYLSAQGSAKYIESNNPGGSFTKHSIKLYYQNYNHPIYNQLGNQFITHIGIYDLLFNEGFENSLEIIRSGNMEDIHYKIFRKKYMSIESGGLK